MMLGMDGCNDNTGRTPVLAISFTQRGVSSTRVRISTASVTDCVGILDLISEKKFAIVAMAAYCAGRSIKACRGILGISKTRTPALQPNPSSTGKANSSSARSALR